jgi:hypothetical protein
MYNPENSKMKISRGPVSSEVSASNMVPYFGVLQRRCILRPNIEEGIEGLKSILPGSFQLFYKVINPIHEGRALMARSPPTGSTS